MRAGYARSSELLRPAKRAAAARLSVCEYKIRIYTGCVRWFCIDKGQEWAAAVENNGLTVNAIFYCMHFFDIYIRTVFGEWCMAAACFLCIQ